MMDYDKMYFTKTEVCSVLSTNSSMDSFSFISIIVGVNIYVKLKYIYFV